MSKEIGPKERMLREQREARFARNVTEKKSSSKLSTSELREQVAAVQARPPKPKMAKKRAKR